MINITDKELKKIDFEFRTIAGRVTRAKFSDAIALLQQFVEFIERTPLIADYVHSCKLPIPEQELKDDVQGVAESYGRNRFQFATSVEGEIAQLFGIMRMVAESKNDRLLFGIGRAYNHGNPQENTDGFIYAIVQRFIEDINLYLHELSMNIRTDVEKSYVINNNNGQVVISNNSSNVSVTQSNMDTVADFQNRKVELMDALGQSQATGDQLAQIRNSLLAIEESLKGGKNRTVLAALTSGLESIASTVANGALFVTKVRELSVFIAGLFA